MTNCKFCGTPAGPLYHEHPECTRAHQEAESQLIAGIAAALGSEIESDLPSTLAALASKSFVSKEEQERLLADGWIAAMDGLLSSGIITAADQCRLLTFANSFGLRQDALNGDGAIMMLAKAVMLGEVLHGRVPDQGARASNLPIRFLQEEHVVWIFPQTSYWEDMTQSFYVEGRSGVSVHVMKGAYYHALSFKGHPVDHTDRVHVDTGTCVATSMNLYLAGSSKSLRIPYAEIVSFYPFSDGLGVMRNAASAKLQVFATGDGWFAYNLFSNLARL